MLKQGQMKSQVNGTYEYVHATEPISAAPNPEGTNEKPLPDGRVAPPRTDDSGILETARNSRLRQHHETDAAAEGRTVILDSRGRGEWRRRRLGARGGVGQSILEVVGRWERHARRSLGLGGRKE